MKYLKQFFIIVLISFLGEIMKCLIPLPIPASIYGMLLMLAALCTHIITVEKVKEASTFLIQIMPVLFIPASVGLMNSWGELQQFLLPIVVIIIVTTVAVMAVSGRVTQAMIRRGKKKQEVGDKCE